MLIQQDLECHERLYYRPIEKQFIDFQCIFSYTMEDLCNKFQ